jgi:hypothetical protein
VDLLNGAVEMTAGFDVHRNMSGARSDECVDVALWFDDHEMTVERQIDGAAQRVDYRYPDADIRHEHAIHHIDVQPVGAGCGDFAHLLAETRKIGGKDGRHEAYRTLVGGDNRHEYSSHERMIIA